MCRGFCAPWRLTRWKYSGAGFVPEPNARAIRCVADEFDAGVFESGADEPEVCRCSRGQSCLGFYSLDRTRADFSSISKLLYTPPKSCTSHFYLLTDQT
jgi:hypothetical protein